MADEFLTCPYNREHRIVTFRMPGHLVKCKRNYKGPPLQTCIYNACHLVREGEMKRHLETCRDRHHFHKTDYVLKEYRKMPSHDKF